MAEPSAHQYRTHRMFLDRDTGMPPMTSNGTIGSYTSEANFDSNMVIVLAALLCALICAIGFNSAIRYALRCSYSFGFGIPVQTAALNQLASAPGLKNSALNRIPVVSYEPGLNLSITDCSICLAEFAEGEKVRILPNCSHGYHVKCIDKWLLSNSSCPLCRQALLDNTANGNAEEANCIFRLPENGENSSLEVTTMR